jgi:hypothetical protein
MSIGERISVGPSRAESKSEITFDLGSAPATALDRLFADTELLLAARALLVRATSPINRFAGRAILADRISSHLASSLHSPVPTSTQNHARLEAFAVAERLLDPIARLTAEVEAPPYPTISWSSIAPDAALELENVLDVLRDEVEAPHLDALIRLLDALLEASDESAWAQVEVLAAEQNARAMSSDERIVVFASLFWTEQGTAWPAIYLVEKSESSKCPRLERIAAFFATLEPHRTAPALCFATNLIFSPSKASANAFALHNQAALIFEVVDAERRARLARLAAAIGLEPRQAEEIGRVFLAAHEFGHKYDPLNLPKWTEELFADVAAVVASAEVLDGALSPNLLLRVLLVEALSNYGRPDDDPPSVLYFDSTDQIVARLVALGVVRFDECGDVSIDVDQERWSNVVADFRTSLCTMRAGKLPEYFRRGVPALQPVRNKTMAIISSERI